MARLSNPVLAKGERITEKVDVPKGGGTKNPPYSFATAKRFVSDRARETIEILNALPASACPHGEAVAVLTMHPRYVSKSDFPQDLISEMGARALGSRARTLKPKQWGIKDHPVEGIAEDYFIAANRGVFSQWAARLATLSSNDAAAATLSEVEDLQAFDGVSKLRHIPKGKNVLLEVALHNLGAEDIVDLFVKYANHMGAEVLANHRIDARGLTFVPVRLPSPDAGRLADFAFVRVARGMPQLRPFRPPLQRSSGGFAVGMVPTAVQNSKVRCLIFDGGLPQDARTALSPAVTLVEPAGIGASAPDYERHGLAVTSAYLFGPLEPGQTPAPPICHVDHVRVLDKQTGAAADVLYLDVLARIVAYLDANKGKHDFVNISLGPDMAMLDDEVTAWTALLDERFAGGKVFATVAVGNGGERDHASGLCRIQPPSDAVNVVSVGACDTVGPDWQRATYSSMGPGRTPGRVKPDGLSFGGSAHETFNVLTKPSWAAGTAGTSFAAPLMLRTSTAVNVGLGDSLGLLALRALTIHRAERHKTAQVSEVGWGRFEADPAMLITCEDDEVVVVYQGELPISEHLRCLLPMPNGPTKGMIHLSATLAISPEVDPNNPSSYTRSGLEVAFRPSDKKYRKIKKGEKPPAHPVTKTFFSLKNMVGKGEGVLRDDAHKWEPCMSRFQKFQPGTLDKPVFDVYYHHRAAGAAVKDPKPIPYALVVGIRAPKDKDFYNRVVRAYQGVLVPLKTQVEVRVRP